MTLRFVGLTCLMLLPCPLKAAGASAGAETIHSVHGSAAFVSWLGDEVLLEEQWLEAKTAGIGVAYFLKPLASAGANVKGHAALEDAFFAVDLRNGRALGAPLTRSIALEDGCPGPGEVGQLSILSESKARLDIRLAAGGQTCLVRIDTKGGQPTLRSLPDPKLKPEESFPEAVQALRRSPSFRAKDPASVDWSFFPKTDWLVAAASDSCRVWVVDRISARVEEERSASLTDSLCGCAAEVGADSENPITRSAQVAEYGLAFGWTGPGTAIPSCSCSVDTSLQARCSPSEDRPYSPAQLDEMEEQETEAQQRAEADESEKLEAAERLLPEEAVRERLRNLLKASREANESWRSHREREALSAWRLLYREYLELGKPKDLDGFAAPWEEILALLGNPTDLQHASIDAWAEILNNLGFALWSQHELHQAKGAYAACQALLTATGRRRDILELNLGDLERDLGHLEKAREHYEKYLQGTLTEAQRQRATDELKKLEKLIPKK